MHPIYKTIFILSLSLVVCSVIVLGLYGLKFGIDFTGGSIIELEFENQRPDLPKIQITLVDDGEVSINNFGDKGLIIKTKDLSEQEHQELIKKLKDNFGADNVDEKRFESVGPVIGQELKRKSIIAIVLVLFSIAIYIAFVFRKLARTL